MTGAEKNTRKGAMPKSTMVLITLFVMLVVFALGFIVFCNVVYGSIDGFVQMVYQASLQARYDRIVEGQQVWPWAFWIFFWAFVVILIFILIVVLYLTLMERKLLGWFQIRLGPNRVGPWGLLQPFADMVKLLIKEDIVPKAADKALHLVAPLVIFIPTLLAFVTIPFGAGTIALPQKLVAPTFDQLWVEWIPADAAAERGFSSAGYLETSVAVEENPDAHKTWWVDVETDDEPRFIPTDENGRDPENRFRNPYPLTLQVKPTNPSDPPRFETYYNIIDFATTGRIYDVLEIKWSGSRGHSGVIELGIDGRKIEKVEEQFSDILARTGPEIPYEQRFQFDRPPLTYMENLFGEFTSAVAINNRRMGPDSMTPAFTRSGGDSRASWRDLYSPDWKHTCYILGWVDTIDAKASLYFFPTLRAGEEQVAPESDDWRDTGAGFRVQYVTGGGYTVETPDGTITSLAEFGDAFNGELGGEQVTLTLKPTQYYTVYLIGKDLGIGIVYILAVTSLAVLAIFMAGFGSNNKWSLYGAIRSVAQLMSYEIPMTLAVLGPVLMSGTLSMVDLVESQRTVWFVIPQFVAFYIFMVCMTSEVNRTPFDLPEAESELVAGFHTEYSGLKWGFFYLAEYANMFLAAALMSILFFGGWKGPFDIPFLGEFVSSFIWFIAKCLFWLGMLIWFRATFPRFRIDQMMDYSWKVLLPLSLANIIYTGYFAFSDWHYLIWANNNWRIWSDYIRPLFFNTYTNYFGIPIIGIIVILIGTDIYSNYRDQKKGAEPKGIAGIGK